ncbi:uncharacterized protein LOC115923820 [Strongylocentrotus purpuratus]|uniref:Uncharacterized protein n=1 Tax=Strongylocentrotus purpuratus TaxID=7668 RepID=A0A7M7NV65_STRPU|nr:uncharacterized protein LOC115923820 [Strongylocentrotus purpuratus]
MRFDAGKYISLVYKDGQSIADHTTRVELQIDYPPGKASCDVSEEKGGDWVSIDCTAKVGSLSGKIECYQDGVWIPPLTDPTETDTTLKQKINITTNQPVFCCSSALTEYKERCECNDTALYLDDAISSDPCPTISTETSTISIDKTQDLGEKSQSSNTSNYTLTSHTTSTNANKMYKPFLIAIIIYYITIANLIRMFIRNAIHFYQLRQERKNNSNDESHNLKAIILYYISGIGLAILMILNTISVYQMWPENKNNSNDSESHKKAIFIYVYYISATGVIILFLLNSFQSNQLIQERKQNSNGESQKPLLSGNVHYHYALKCETEKLNQMMMQELATHKTQNNVY